MQTVLITGGTGLIGTAVTRLLISKGYEVIILTRSPKSFRPGVSFAMWNVKKGEISADAVSRADHIIHLAGAGIADKRWTAKRKKEIVESRVNAGHLIVKSLNEIPNKVQTVISASAIGWYGQDKPGMGRGFTETAEWNNDFLGETCRQWEESIHPVEALGKRMVIFRTGIVFSKEGGAFPEFVKPMKAAIAAILGSGKQVISWIHIDDIARMYVYALTNSAMQGVYNATAPETVTNRQLTLAIAKARKRPFIPVHVPEFVLGIYLGEMKIEVLKSTTVDDTKVRKQGFNFLFPSLESAINELITSKGAS